MSTTASSSKKGALIFLHGLGDTPHSWTDELQNKLPTYYSHLREDLELVLPPAPTLKITVNGGARMPGWFDLYDWPIAIGSKDDTRRISKAVETVEKEIAKLEKRGIPASRIIVGGFSQGGVIAMMAAYTRRNGCDALAGCANLSGWLPKDIKVTEACKQTPLFWGHGTMDDVVPFNQQEHGVSKLRAQGVETIFDKSYYTTHSDHPEEIKFLAKFIHQSLLQANAKEEQGDSDDNKNGNKNGVHCNSVDC